MQCLSGPLGNDSDFDLIVFKDAAFDIGRSIVQTSFENNLPYSPVISSSLHQHSIQGRHSCIQPPLSCINEWLSSYSTAKQNDPSGTSALIVLPKFFRKKSWHRHIRRCHHLVSFTPAEFPDLHKYVSLRNSHNVLKFPSWTFDLWYDPPERPASFNRTIYNGDTSSSLVMVFKCKLRGTLVAVLIDSGATHSFVDTALAKRLKLPLQDKPSSVTCGGNTFIQSPGKVAASVVIDSYSDHLEFIVMPLPSAKDFQVVLGQDWLLRYGALIDYTSNSVSFQRQGRVHKFFGKPSDSSCLFSALPIPEPDNGFLMSLHSPGGQSTDDAIGKDKARQILKDFADVFQDIPSGLPPDRGTGHTIPTGTHPPVHRHMYKMSPKEKKCAEDMVDELLQKGWIRPSSSPYSSPILFVQKKDGSLRMCVDYRALNQQTIKDRYPLPRIDDLLDKLLGAQVFTSLDLQSGYHQIRISEDDIPKTAFITHQGLYEYQVLPFGLSNAPAAFQREMNGIFTNLPFVLVYMDDILVFSKNEDDHKEHLVAVLKVLRDQNFYAKLAKCSFFQSEVHFLGHVVSSRGIHVDPGKVKVVTDWPEPKNPSELRSFLGLSNYFKKFIAGYSSVIAPLAKLTSSEEFTFDEKEREAFQFLKNALCKAPVLAIPDDSKPYTLITDASGFGCGAVLMQEDRPVAFWSYKMLPAEKNYSVGEQEMLSVIKALEHWRHYLEGAVSLTIITDHRPNVTFTTKAPESLNRRQVRWLETLARFNYEFQWMKGSTNIADPLSRKSSLLHLSAELESPSMEFLQTVQDGYSHDLSFQDERFTKHFTFDGKLWFKDSLIVIPNASDLRSKCIQLHHDSPYSGHLGVQRTIDLITRFYWWPGIYSDVKDFVIHCDICQRTKVPTQRLPGLLQPLQIPGRRWQSIGTDMITRLPESVRGNNAIIVFVDRLSKMVHLAPTTMKVTSQEYAEIFLKEVYSKHGMPTDIVSDRDPRFTSEFFRLFCQSLGIQQNMSVAFHHETDGQTERMNQFVESVLRAFINPEQNNWDLLLPLVEFAINNAYQASIKTSPFFLNYGEHPRTPSDSSIPLRGVSNENRLQQIHLAVKRAKASIQAAQDSMAAYENRHRRDLEFQVGDFVLLHSKNLDLHFPGSKKLAHLYFGPFKVLQRVGKLNYELEVPNSMKIHDVFHISSLKLYRSRGDGIIVPPPAFLPTGFFEDEISSIAEHLFTENSTDFLVIWKDNTSEWIPFQFLGNARDLVSDYCKRNGIPMPVLKSQAKKAKRIERNQVYKEQRAGVRKSARIAAKNDFMEIS